MHRIWNIIELKTSEEMGKNIDMSNDIQNEKVSMYDDYGNAEVQTSEKPKSGSCIGKVEEFYIHIEP